MRYYKIRKEGKFAMSDTSFTKNGKTFNLEAHILSHLKNHCRYRDTDKNKPYGELYHQLDPVYEDAEVVEYELIERSVTPMTKFADKHIQRWNKEEERSRECSKTRDINNELEELKRLKAKYPTT